MLAECFEHINKLPNVSVQADVITRESAESKDSEGQLILSTPMAFLEYVYLKKSLLNNANLQIAIAHLKSLASYLGLKPLLVSKHISDSLMQKLIDLEIEFIDTSGNMYFNGPGVYILIRGNRPSSQKKETSAFTTAGVKVIYTLLCQPQILESTYREIANSAGVALGTANNVIHDLHKSGYLLRQRGGNYCIKDYQKLLSLWEFGYAERLRSKLFIGNFSITKQKTFPEAIPELVEKAHKENYLIGGELAALICTNYLRPQSATLHVGEDYRRTVIGLGLQPNQRGEIKILRTFGTLNGWKDCIYSAPLANPLLIRAELLLESSERLHETAEVLGEKFMPLGDKNAFG